MTAYGGADFKNSWWWKERCLFILLGCLGKPESYLDIGCGDNHFVKLMGRLVGEDNAWGVDLESPDIHVIVHDLREPLDLKRKFDMVVSLEVGEHLPEKSADVYCDSLVKHVGQWLVFSAAHVGQSGWHHINRQDKNYWKEKLTGLEFMAEKTDRIVNAWAAFVPPSCRWAHQNLMIFKGGSEK